jgi:WD40 repeat protein
MRQGRIHTLLTDIDRLLVMYREPIIHSALHVYYSALATMPSCLLLKQMAADDGYRIPLLISKRAPSWGLREIIVDQRGQVHCVAYSPNGTLIATIAHHQPTDSSTRFVAVQVWDLSTGTALYIWNQYYKNVTEPRLFGSATFSPNGQWIAFTEHSTLRVWDVVTGSQECIMEGHSDTAWCITFSPDSTTIVSGSWDRTLRVWDASTGAERLVMIGHTASVNALAFAPDGQTIVSASSDGTLRVWDVLSGTKLRVIHADRGELYCVAFSPDGATIASGGWNGTIQLWSATSGSRQHAFEGHNMGVRSFAFSPDGKSIVSCDMDGLARIWDAMTGIEKRSLRGGVRSVAYSPDGKSIALGLADGTTRIWDANTDATTHSSTDGHQAPINSVSFSPDGMLIASGSDDCTLRVWNANTGAEQHVMHVKDAVTFVAFSPDSRTIACGQLYGTVQWWDVASGLEQSSRTGQHESAVRSVAFSPDSKSIVSYSDSDGTARVWDMITGAVQHTLTHPRFDMDPKRRAVFSTDGKAIILRKYYRSLTGVVIGSWDLTTTTQPQYAESTSAQVHDFRASEQSGIGLPRYLHAEGSPWIQQLHNGPHREEQRDICWLPKEFRGTMTYSGTKVCVGGQNGAITILDFSPVGLLQYDGGQYRSLSGSAFISIRSESLRR